MSEENIDNLFYIYIKQINNEIRNNFYNSENKPCEFIIFLYYDDESINWKRISEIEGVRVIRLSDITDIDVSNPQFTISETDVHPNAKAWENVVPVLVKELNL